jgi:hypothetical protein
MPTTMTCPNDPQLDARITAAILERVAAGDSFPDATRTVGQGALDEARAQRTWGAAEQQFVAAHVARIGADLMARIADIVRGDLAAVA